MSSPDPSSGGLTAQEFNDVERWADDRFSQGDVAVVMRLVEFGWLPPNIVADRVAAARRDAPLVVADEEALAAGIREYASEEVLSDIGCSMLAEELIAAGVVASLAEDEAGLRERITALLASRACHQCGGTGRTTNMEQGAPASVGKQELVECSLCVGGGYLNLGYVPVKDLAAALAAPADGGGTE